MGAQLSFALPPSVGRAAASDRAALLQTYLSSALELEVTVSVAVDYKALKNGLITGGIGAAWGPPYVCSRIEAYGGRALVRGIRNGRSTYRSALVAQAARRVDLTSSVSLRFAWVDPDSIGGYLLPQAYLRERGVYRRQAIAHEHFAGSYLGAVEAVLSGSAHVAPVWAPADEAPDPLPGLVELAGKRHHELAVLGFSQACPNDGVVASSALDSGLAERVQRAFLEMSNRAEGHAILRGVFGADRFELAPTDSFRQLHDLVFGSGAPDLQARHASRGSPTR